MNKPLRELCAQATPGPWINCREEAIDYRPQQIVNVVIGSRIAVMSGGGPVRAVCGPEEIANAELIARLSPDTALAVLEALEGAKESLNAWNGPVALAEYQHSPEIKRINNAVARLNGETL